MPFSIPPNFNDETTIFHQGSNVSELVVQSFETELDRPGEYVIYRGGVKATLGVSVLSADVLIVRKGKPDDVATTIDVDGKLVSLRPMEAMALGKVSVIDPEGTMQASNLWFTWNKDRRKNLDEVTGTAELVEVRIGNSHIKASKAVINGLGFEFSKVSFWTGNWRTPLFKFDADSLFVFPGKNGVARKMKLSLLGIQLPIIPKFTFSLDPRSDSLTLPAIGFRQGDGVGLSWATAIPISDSSKISAALTSFPNVQPTYTVSYLKSNLQESEIGKDQFVVSSLFGERSRFSFFQSIYGGSLADVHDRMKVKKSLFSVSSTFNTETLGRVTDRVTNYSQPFQVGYELGGAVGDWAYQIQTSGARIVEGGSKSAIRLMLEGSAFAPLVHSGRLTVGTRFDASARIDSSSSGYFGAESGFSYEAIRNLNLSGGAYGYKSLGTPLFDGDNFRSNQGYVLRGDLIGASTNISMMFRYDPTQGWFDREYRISQVVGPVEPVLVYRASPRQYVFGLKFRTQDIANLLQNRKVKRNNQGSGKTSQ